MSCPHLPQLHLFPSFTAERSRNQSTTDKLCYLMSSLPQTHTIKMTKSVCAQPEDAHTLMTLIFVKMHSWHPSTRKEAPVHGVRVRWTQSSALHTFSDPSFTPDRGSPHWQTKNLLLSSEITSWVPPSVLPGPGALNLKARSLHREPVSSCPV